LHHYERSLTELTFAEGYFGKLCFLYNMPLLILSISIVLMIIETNFKISNVAKPICFKCVCIESSAYCSSYYDVVGSALTGG
jgi:hypothetical protein